MLILGMEYNLAASPGWLGRAALSNRAAANAVCFNQGSAANRQPVSRFLEIRRIDEIHTYCSIYNIKPVALISTWKLSEGKLC